MCYEFRFFFFNKRCAYEGKIALSGRVPPVDCDTIARKKKIKKIIKVVRVVTDFFLNCSVLRRGGRFIFLGVVLIKEKVGGRVD